MANPRSVPPTPPETPILRYSLSFASDPFGFVRCNDRKDITLFECPIGFDVRRVRKRLAIVREIAEAHNWEVTITASKEGGARFEIMFEERR